MLRLSECAGRADVGSKAEVLGRARRLGLPVLDGLLILPDEPLDETAIAGALREIGGGPFAVRSSALAEDRAGRSAAGLFLSRIGVAPPDVVSVIRAVRASG